MAKKKVVIKKPKKVYGKPVMRKVSKTRSEGYATASKTVLPKMKKRKVGKGASKQAKRSYKKLK